MSGLKNNLISSVDGPFKPKPFAKFRGKTAKEVYRLSKGIVLTGSVTGPAAYAAISIPKEMSKGFIYSAVGSIGESLIGYISGIGFVRWIYVGTNVPTIKSIARIIYNFASLPITIYSKGLSSVCDVLQISKIESLWFGTPVYIFDDNRLWIEANFTLEDAFKEVSNMENK